MTYRDDEGVIENFFSPAVSEQAMKLAILSACFGVVSQYILRESSIIILYATKIGAGSFITLLTTALQPLSIAVLIIPIAYIMEHTGKRALMIPALSVSIVGGVIVATAGFFQDASRVVLMVGLLLFSISVSFFAAGWFPLLQGIVPKQKRGTFFRNMRVSWQLVLTSFLFISVLFVGRDAPLYILQLIIFIAAIMMLGRILAIRKVPELPKRSETLGLKDGLACIFCNRSLIRFSLYMFFLYLFSNATLPMSMMFAKRALHAPDNYTVFLSTIITIGQIIGYFSAGFVLQRWLTPRKLLLSANVIFILLNLLFLFIQQFNVVTALFLSALVMAYGACFAYSTIGLSSEVLALAQPNALNMSIATCVAFYISGQGLSRMLSGILLDAPFIPERWTLLGMPMSNYHVLYFGFGICLLFCFILIVFVPKGKGEGGSVPQY